MVTASVESGLAREGGYLESAASQSAAWPVRMTNFLKIAEGIDAMPHAARAALPGDFTLERLCRR